MPRRLALFALLLAVIPAGAQDASKKTDGERVFVCGHSFHVMIPAPLAEMAKAAGLKEHKNAGMQFIGGSRVIQHWDMADDKNRAKKLAAAGEIDVLTLSPHIKMPDEGIDKFADLLLEKNKSARIFVQASWAPFDLAGRDREFKNDDRDTTKIEDLRKAYVPFQTAITDQVNAVNARHKGLGRQVIFLVPVGEAVVRLRELVIAGKVPGITKQSELFSDPIGHAKYAVAILNAYCHYTAIYGRSPVGLPVPSGLKKDEDKLNTLLQEIAWETVTSEPLSGVKKDAPAAKKDAGDPLEPSAVIAKALKAVGGEDKLLRLFKYTEEFLIAGAKTKTKRASVVEPPDNWWLGTKSRNPEPASWLVYAWTLGMLTDKEIKFTSIAAVEEDGKKLVGLRASGRVKPDFDLHFDPETWMLVRVEWRKEKYVFSDWKEVDGVKYASKSVGYKAGKEWKEWVRTEILEIERLKDLPPGVKRD